jgi:hypothetical protein
VPGGDLAAHVFSSDVPAANDPRRGDDRQRPASADESAGAGPGDEPQVNVERILDEVRAACRRIRDAWRDASR